MLSAWGCVSRKICKTCCHNASVWPRWTLYISLVAFCKSRSKCHCGMKIPPLPNKWLIVLLSHFRWREVITGPYESEMTKSIRGWIGGRGPGAPRGVRTRKLITWYWWRTSTLASLRLPSPHLPVLSKVSDTGAWSRCNFLLKWYSETAASHTFEGHS